MESKTILVVEDEKDLLFLICKKLTDSGFAVVGFETGQQALDYIATNTPDLAILDILLPDIDGVTILNEIAKRSDLKKMPVIIFSNLADRGSFDQVAAVGNYEYLVKSSTDLNDLVIKIREKLAGK